MLNIDMKVKGSKLLIEVDLAQEHGKSASGKTTIIASTQGNTSVEGPNGSVSVGLNVYKK